MLKWLLISFLLSSCNNPLIEGGGVSTFDATSVPFTESALCDDKTKFLFDENQINVSPGTCSLKPIDQMDDDYSDLGFAGASKTGVVWDSVTGAVKLGSSSNCDGSVTNCSFFSESWTPQFSQLLGHWRLDEASGNFSDSTGRGNDLLPYGTLTRGVSGKIQEALNFGSGSYLKSTSAITYFDSHKTNSFTYSIWVRPTLTRNVTTETNSGISGTSGQRYAVYPGCTDGWNGLNNTACTGISVGTNGITVFEHGASHMPSPLVYNTSISDWVHVVVVYQNKTPHLYLNGVLVRTGVTSSRAYVIPSSYLGDGTAAWNGNYGPFRGDLDEYAVWGVALTAAEVANLYQRQSPQKAGYFTSRIIDAETSQVWSDIYFKGENDIKYQVRSCANSNCSDGSWMGVDGTPNSYFSSAAQSITVLKNRYFQYQMVLEADTISSILPEVSEVEVLPIHYPVSPALIEFRTALEAKKINSINWTEDCDSGVKFTISDANDNWYYWNGSTWSISNGSLSQANLASNLDDGLPFLHRDLKSEKFKFRAHLSSVGAACDLNDLNIRGER